VIRQIDAGVFARELPVGFGVVFVSVLAALATSTFFGDKVILDQLSPSPKFKI
jgi:hypothetical protein